MHRVVSYVPLGLLAIAPALGGCNQTVDGVTPVGGALPSAVEIERYARRLHLDLAAAPPPEAFLQSAVDRLTADPTAAARDAVAAELIDRPGFAGVFVSELENRAMGGATAEEQYDFLCGVVRGTVPACMACPPPAGDVCGGCACPQLTELVADRRRLRDAAADLGAGAPSGAIERRYADSQAFRALLGAPAAQAAAMFDVFLGRPPEADELRNAAAIATGSLLPGTPAGLLFHRYGAGYADLVDIVFESEVYREAAVAGVFGRYLGRPPTPVEAAHFGDLIAPPPGDAPDVRPVIRAVVSSREYFEQ